MLARYIPPWYCFGMKLATYLETKAIRHGDFAVLIGTSQAAVTRYARGDRMPRPEQMAAITRETRGAVTANDFHDLARTAAPARTEALAS